MLNPVYENNLPDFARPIAAGSCFYEMLDHIRPGFRDFHVESPERNGPFTWHMELLQGTGVSSLHARYGTSFTYTPQRPDDSLVVRFCDEGAAETRIRGTKITSTPGTAIVSSWREMGRTSVLTGTGEHSCATSTFFVFDPSVVRSCLLDLYDGATLSQLEITPLLDLDSNAGHVLAGLCNSLSQGMSGERFLERSPKSMALLIEAAVRVVLEQTPHRLNCPPRNRHLPAVPRHVKRAIEYMHANMHKPLRLVDIAAAAGTSTRTLQIGFKEFRQTTPLHYLREIRLQAVRAELSTPENTLPVREVALKWGFCHLGRFAAHYKAAFGEAPSDTARNPEFH